MKRRDFCGYGSARFGGATIRNGGPNQRKQNRLDAGKQKIMAVSTHPADFSSRAGGTLIRHVRAGFKVRVVWLSHGETNESDLLYRRRSNISLDQVRRIREKEAFAAAEVIGAEGRMLGFGDNPLRMTPERMEVLAREMADFGGAHG